MLDQIDEGGIEEHEAVFGVIDDVDDLLDEQARVDGVAHRAHAGDAVVQLEMAVAVPGQRRDAVARFDAERDQRVGELRPALQQAGVVGALIGLVRRSRDDLDVGEVRAACVRIDDSSSGVFIIRPSI